MLHFKVSNAWVRALLLLFKSVKLETEWVVGSKIHSSPNLGYVCVVSATSLGLEFGGYMGRYGSVELSE